MQIIERMETESCPKRPAETTHETHAAVAWSRLTGAARTLHIDTDSAD